MSEKEERKKCTKEGYCHWLWERLNENNANAKGFANCQMMDMKSGNIFVTTPVYKHSSKDNGLFIEYCPFCGAKMAPIRNAWRKEATASKK